jgi:hypothetical protein
MMRKSLSNRTGQFNFEVGDFGWVASRRALALQDQRVDAGSGGADLAPRDFRVDRKS